MKLCRYLPRLAETLSGSVVAIGNFDGIHLGHQKIIRQAHALASHYHVPLVLLTFEPSPKVFFQPEQQHVKLQRLSEKYFSLRDYSVDVLFCQRFDADFAMLSAQQFVEHYLVEQLKVRAVVVGEDFKFGAQRQGDLFLLRQLGNQFNFAVKYVPNVEVDGIRVSSSRLRLALADADLDLVSKLLGRPYSMTSRVIYGDQRGRQWGFPTANCPVFRNHSAVNGIFAVHVEGDDFRAKGVASVGFRPVFAVKKPLLEVFILDFDRDIYGQRLKVEFLYKIREEQNFDRVDALVERIHQDVLDARDFFQSVEVD